MSFRKGFDKEFSDRDAKMGEDCCPYCFKSVGKKHMNEHILNQKHYEHKDEFGEALQGLKNRKPKVYVCDKCLVFFTHYKRCKLHVCPVVEAVTGNEMKVARTHKDVDADMQVAVDSSVCVANESESLNLELQSLRDKMAAFEEAACAREEAACAREEAACAREENYREAISCIFGELEKVKHEQEVLHCKSNLIAKMLAKSNGWYQMPGSFPLGTVSMGADTVVRLAGVRHDLEDKMLNDDTVTLMMGLEMQSTYTDDVAVKTWSQTHDFLLSKSPKVIDDYVDAKPLAGHKPLASNTRLMLSSLGFPFASKTRFLHASVSYMRCFSPSLTLGVCLGSRTLHFEEA